MREVGQTLSHLPIKDFQAIGHYFLAVASNNCGKGDQQEARRLFQLVADTAASTYKAKAIQSLAGVSANTGNYDAELYYLNESLKASQDIATTLITHRGIAVYKAKEGYHRHALRDLETLSSLIKYATPAGYFDYLNSYAVELGTVGRLTEACDVIKVVMAAPFSPFYPEWQETLLDLRSKHKPRSRIAFSPRQIEQGYEAELETPDNVIDKARVRVAIAFMKANLHRKISRADIASAVRLSTPYFSDIFKLETGVTLGEYLIRLRMEKANELLVTTLLSIKEIMAEAGFHNKSNFTRSFRKHFHVTPSEYRRRSL